MDFSPYKPSPDEDRKDRLKGKGKSRSPATASYEPVPTSSSSYQAGGNVPPSLYEEGLFTPGPSLGPSMGGAPGGTVRVNKYETRLPIRVDLEAALAYILGPVTGILLLILETRNDYVRFHAWQSSLLFLTLMCVHFILMFISSVLSWILFAIDILLIIGLTYRAYLDGAYLERTPIPYFGQLASQWTDEE
ncbi:hypothetical protein VTP01DRAFT_10565 [Rhizomucor pusillus]|uniref:uncharacterized protein n=1 Tax=Rhizomucor pusillus TaxID=4840 RepID=UPI0037429EB4